ncbi:MAG: dihydroorotase [Cyanothece sp. SIO1E1]|nr:dihydroorotase [Cyanothece sp. SIO1E1]
MTCELLQQVRIVDPVSETDRVADVLIAEGRIEAIADTVSSMPANTLTHDCRGMVLGPGLVDLYSHSGEPGFEARETLNSLTQAAVAGGFTRLAILPDTNPPLDHPAGLALQTYSEGTESSVGPQSLIQLYYWGALTLGAQGEEMTELAELASAGVIGFTDGKPLQNSALLRRLLEYLHPFSQPVALWPCDLSLSGNGVAREGTDSIHLGLLGNPAIAETTALATLLECVAAIGTPVHIMRVSTARSVELIQMAKAQGLPITASTTWMHVLLNTQALKSYSPHLRLDPPLGCPQDQQALIQGLETGVIDAIAIDHTPYTYEEKTVAFTEAPPGAIGLELALPLLWQTFVGVGRWSALQLWRCLSTHPAHCLHQTPATIELGQMAELTLMDPQQSWRVDENTLNSRSANTPWLGQQLSGRVIRTWCPPRQQ